VKSARLRYLEAPNPASNSSMETQRLLRFQNLLTSPINRRSVPTRSSGVSNSDSSSENSTDDEQGASILDLHYDIDNDSVDSDNEETNDLLDNLLWRFTGYEPTDDRLRDPAHKKTVYIGSTQLKVGVAASFKTPLGALQVVGGFDLDTVKRICRNSNEYIKRFIMSNTRDQLLYGMRFEDITVEEMMKFFGIMLRMSLHPIDFGGYPAYFARTDEDIILDGEQTIRATGPKGWASDIMDLRRFKIIRKTFHPEDRLARACGDKCYQIRHLLRNFKAAAKTSFTPGRDISFDEGGIGSRHRRNPVRMYNGKKPQKFRVDFFICASTEADNYVIFHIDIYQGRNACNVDIAQEAQWLPTTMKAVINAVVQLDLHNDPRGCRIFALDNR